MSDTITKDTHDMEDIETNANKGLRVSAICREIDGKSAVDQEEKAMLSRLREEVRKRDNNRDGEIDTAEMVAILRGVIESRDEKKVLRKIIYGVVAIVVLLILATLGTGFAVAALTRQISSKDSNGVPALVSVSSGEMLYTRPDGSGGSTMLLAAFTSCDVTKGADCAPHRILSDVPADVSPNGRDLQCAGVTLRADVIRAVRNAEETASPIRMAYQIENQPQFVNVVLPSYLIEQLPERQENDRRLFERTRDLFGYNMPYYQAPQHTESQGSSFNYKTDRLDEFQSPNFGGGDNGGNEGGLKLDINMMPNNNIPEFRRRLHGDLPRRRLFSEDYAHPLGAPWYDFMAESVPLSVTIVCDPEITGNPGVCMICSAGAPAQTNN